MSEEAKSEGKKKGSKLPLIVAVALILGGGGFFMTKKGDPGPIKIEASEEPATLGEMTMNLRDVDKYIKFEILLVARKDYPKEKLEKNLDLVRDYINGRVPDFSLGEINSESGKAKMRKLLCEGINEILPGDPKMVDPAESSKKIKKKKSEEDAADEAEHWDCPKGPILKVLFKSFAWQ